MSCVFRTHQRLDQQEMSRLAGLILGQKYKVRNTVDTGGGMKYLVKASWFYVSGVMLFGFLSVGGAFGAAEDPTTDEEAYLNLFYEEEQLVVVATRSPKPISQIAENVTIITAEEIEAMNAHTVAEVLNRVPGLFVVFPQDFGSGSSLSIQTSDYEHVLVLVDGIRWNNVSNDFAETNTIPIQIVKRIEIIKGPGSSTWGSALGGIVNIITKDTGKGSRPSGLVSASYGEADSQDYRGEVSGSAGRFGYYLFSGKQKSDGLRNERFFESDNVYGKATLDLTADMELGLTFGYSEPEYRQFRDFAILDEDRQLTDSIKFATTTFDFRLTDEVTLNLTGHLFENNQEQPSYEMGGWYGGGAGNLLWNYQNEMQRQGASGRIVLARAPHTAVVGAEIVRNRQETVNFYGPSLGVGGPLVEVPPTQVEEIWAVYGNDTMVLGRLTLTPGLRFDHHSISENMWSPSIGLTYRLGEKTLLRGAVSRGFRKPALFLLADNPSFLHEKIWTYQAGVETKAIRYVHLKTTAFRHDADNIWTKEGGTWVNSNKSRRVGIEVAVETVPFYDFSVAANYTYVDMNFDNDPNYSDEYDYTLNLLLRYDNPHIVKAELFGHYVQWGESYAPSAWNGVYDDMIWDFNISKEFRTTGHIRPTLFFTAHNLFNGSQYWDEILKNPERWVEAGLRFRFF
jgi:vitamin B12 transporter